MVSLYSAMVNLLSAIVSLHGTMVGLHGFLIGLLSAMVSLSGVTVSFMASFYGSLMGFHAWGHGDPLRCNSDSVMVFAVALGRSVYNMSVHKMFPTRYLASLPLNLNIFSVNLDTT
jgi:hypothetical protein